MKQILYILICCFLYSCNNKSQTSKKEVIIDTFKDSLQNNEINQNISFKNNFKLIDIDFPSTIKLEKYKFPKKWQTKGLYYDNNKEALKDTLNNIQDTILYKTRRCMFSFYDTLSCNKTIKLPFIPIIKEEINKEDFFKIDSAYYSGTFPAKNDIFVLEIYKNGNKYASLKGDETAAPVDYLTLITKNKKTNEIIDYKVIYNYIYMMYEPKYCYFYIDNSLKIHLYYFDIDEIESHFVKEEIYQIDKKGKFIKQ